MASFKSNGGKTTWDVLITVGKIGRMRRDLGVNFSKISRDPKEMNKLFEDEPDKYVGVFYVLCEEQVKERGLTPEQFGELFDGPTNQSADKAWHEACADFFLRPSLAVKAKRKLGEAYEAAEREMEASLDKSPEELAQTSGTPSTGSGQPTGLPGSPGSRPSLDQSEN